MLTLLFPLLLCLPRRGGFGVCANCGVGVLRPYSYPPASHFLAAFWQSFILTTACYNSTSPHQPTSFPSLCFLPALCLLPSNSLFLPYTPSHYFSLFFSFFSRHSAPPTNTVAGRLITASQQQLYKNLPSPPLHTPNSL